MNNLNVLSASLFYKKIKQGEYIDPSVLPASLFYEKIKQGEYINPNQLITYDDPNDSRYGLPPTKYKHTHEYARISNCRYKWGTERDHDYNCCFKNEPPK